MNSGRGHLRLSILAALLAGAVGCMGSPITFTFEGSASGAIGANAFLNSNFVLSAFADTANVLPFAQGFTVVNTSASIDIVGQGTFAFTGVTRTFVNQVVNAAGFSDGVGGLDLLFVYGDPGLGTYGLTTAYGPNSLPANYFSPPALPTTGGSLTFNTAPATLTFQAAAGSVPEPSLAILTALAVSLVSFRGRRSLAQPSPSPATRP